MTYEDIIKEGTELYFNSLSEIYSNTITTYIKLRLLLPRFKNNYGVKDGDIIDPNDISKLNDFAGDVNRFITLISNRIDDNVQKLHDNKFDKIETNIMKFQKNEIKLKNRENQLNSLSEDDKKGIKFKFISWRLKSLNKKKEKLLIQRQTYFVNSVLHSVNYFDLKKDSKEVNLNNSLKDKKQGKIDYNEMLNYYEYNGVEEDLMGYRNIAR